MIDGRRRILSTLALAALGTPIAVAQEKKPARIAILSRTVFPEREFQAFRDGLRDLGHVEGRTYVIELRYAGDDDARLRELAVEVARSNPDVVFAVHGQAAQFAKEASSTIPIVFGGSTDPVAEGLVASLARPGGNATGFGGGIQTDVNSKRLELLRDALPTLKRVAVLYIPNSRGSLSQLEGFKAAGVRLKIEILPVEVRAGAELGPAFANAAQRGAEAITHIGSPLFRSQLDVIVALAARHRVPALSDGSDFVEAGGLMSYGSDRRYYARRAATLVDRILKGAKPADLPVEQSRDFEFLINAKTARALGLTIPQTVLMLADRIIE